MAINLDIIQALGLSVVVLLFGQFLVRKIKFLETFCIPAPVIGGLVFSIITLIGNQTGTFSIDFDSTLKDFFMICFFATIGFGADLSVLKKGGKSVVLFLGITVVLVVIQNITGVGIAMMFGKDPLFGLTAGSVPMVGGHGTSAAFGPILESAGLVGATTYAVAAATFGLISGSLIGGPTARRLIEKHKLAPEKKALSKKDAEIENAIESDENIRASYLVTAFFQIAISVGLGSVVSLILARFLPNVTFPPYIGAMLVAVIMRNVFNEKSVAPTRVGEISALGNIFLSIFLAQALMALKLWQLAELALPLVTIIVLQVVIMYLWATYVTFNVMGRNYDAAVLSAGNCGFGLGATPNAMANMNAVVAKYGPSPTAFFVLPIVGSLFIDFFNSVIITAFISFVTNTLK